MAETVTLEEPNKLLANVRNLLTDVTAVGDAIGGYTVKADARQTGASIHFRFEEKVDVAAVTMRFVGIVQSSPGLLAAALRQLEAALVERDDVDG